MKDRFSLHIDNGQVDNREAVTVRRDGGTASQSGLVGITNGTYADGQDPYLPETVFNVQSTGDSNIRLSSGPSVFHRSSLELLGNGNTRSSGLHISYDPELDNAFFSGTYGQYGYGICVDPNGADNTVADISLIRPSGTEGLEFSHISLTERGYVGVGKLRTGSNRHFNPIAPLTVAYACESINNSGAIAQLEQSNKPSIHAGFGQIYVKPFTAGGRSQAIYFLDDGGTETNLVLSDDLSPENSIGGLIFGDNGNTYGGWYTSKVRQADATKSNNTYYGWGAGFDLSNAGTVTCNTLIGYRAGSGLQPTSSYNTVVGCDSLAGFTSAQNNVVIGRENVNGGNGAVGGMDDSIIIGTQLYQGNVPEDGTLSIGISTPLITGKLTGTKSVTIVDGTLSVLNTSNAEIVFSTEFDNTFGRYTNVIDLVDPDSGGSDYAGNNLEFRFTNDDDLSMTLFQIEPRNGPMTNSFTFTTPSPRLPYARLDADFQLRGAIRFQDNTSLSGLSYLDLAGVDGTSGIDGRSSGGQSFVVLDYSSLDLVGNLSNDIRTDNTFIAAQVDGTNSQTVGKMSLQGLADYVSSGASSIAENCNVLISNPENELNVNTAGMARTVMIGCDVATGASGWHHAVMIGSEAGVNASVSNPGLTSDFSAVFIGHRAGYDCDNLENTVAIGTNAGNNADTANGSVFIGSNAGLDTNQKNGVGIGEHALRGQTGVTETGSGNLEIVAGIDDNDRLMYNATGLNNRFNIMNAIAGRQDRANVAIGVPRLSPTAPLEVRRFSSVHDANGNDYVQAWYCDDVLIAHIDCDGNFVVGGGEGLGASSIEGIMDAQVTGGNIGAAASGLMSIYVDGVNTGDNAYISNRDATLTGIPPGTYVMATRMGSEYRPSWVGCF